MGNSKTLLVSAAVVILVLAAILLIPELNSLDTGNTEDGRNRTVETVATDLKVPWDIEFLPEGDMLVTERPG